MSGTKEGASKGVKAIKQKYGEDYYREIGRKGGSAKHKSPQGFAVDNRTWWQKLLKYPTHAQITGRMSRIPKYLKEEEKNGQ